MVPEDELIQLAEGGYFNSSRKEVLAGSVATLTSFLIALLTCHDLGPYLFAAFLAISLTSAVTSFYLFFLVRRDNCRVREYVKSLREAKEV